MPKKSVYTQITPIPHHIPRQLAIDMLHSHGEIIELNPLVLEHHPIKAPQSASADEYFSVWHEITERIQYIPGTCILVSGKISFKGVFHDMPWGLQTHIYAPMGVDLRNKWQIRGNQPGEPAEPRELGSGAPADGLYLREDVEIRCNITVVPFVKKELRAASATMCKDLSAKQSFSTPASCTPCSKTANSNRSTPQGATLCSPLRQALAHNGYRNRLGSLQGHLAMHLRHQATHQTHLACPHPTANPQRSTRMAQTPPHHKTPR